MAVVLFAFEALTVMAGKWFPTQSYTLSPTTLMLCIVMMRWDGFAAIHVVVGGLAFCITAGAEPRQFLVYCIGNCFALLGLVVLKLCGKEKVRSRIPFSVIFVVTITGRYGAQKRSRFIPTQRTISTRPSQKPQ